MTISLTHLLTVLVLAAFLWVALDWFYDRLRDRVARRKNSRQARECHLCGHFYRVSDGAKISDCPECSGQNLRSGHKKLG